LDAVAPLVDVDDQSDITLGRAGGDIDAFAELYRRYECKVYSFMRARTPDEAVAEDLTASVFFKAFASARSWRAEGSYRSWLFQIARNTLSSYRSGPNALPVGEVPEEIDPSPSPVLQAIANEEKTTVIDTLDTLPSSQREVVVLRYLSGMSTEAVARVTGRSEGAVRTLLHRARGNLRTSLENRGIAR
jgi:RNA polymerase sigma-70 factor (ECF subfamily)